MARPKFEVKPADQRTVKALAGIGIPHEHIAREIKTTPKTLRKHFRKELDVAADEANMRVSKTMFKMATSGTNATATIFWMKVRCGWREKAQDETKTKAQKEPQKEHREAETGNTEGFSVIAERAEER